MITSECELDRGSDYAQHCKGKRRDEIQFRCEHLQFPYSFRIAHGPSLRDVPIGSDSQRCHVQVRKTTRLNGYQIHPPIICWPCGFLATANPSAEAIGNAKAMIAEWLQDY